MKNKTVVRCLLIISVACLLAMTACIPTRRKIVRPLGDGYSDVAYYSGLVHVGVRSELWYQPPTGKKQLVWRSIWSEAITNNLIVFKGPIYLNEGDPRAKKLRFFVFQPPGPAVEITRELLHRAAIEKGESYEKALKTATPGSLEKEDGGIRIGFIVDGWTSPTSASGSLASSYMKFSWAEVSEILREGKQEGIPRKDPRTGISYLEKPIKVEPREPSEGKGSAGLTHTKIFEVLYVLCIYNAYMRRDANAS